MEILDIAWCLRFFLEAMNSYLGLRSLSNSHKHTQAVIGMVKIKTKPDPLTKLVCQAEKVLSPKMAIEEP